MKNYLLILLLLFPLISLGQESTIPAIEYPEASIQKEQLFHRNSLWGYMNGGADLYLEYGFEELKVMELIIDSVTVKVEIFSMENPLMARGIYSVKAGGIKYSEASDPRTTNPYQVQRPIGRYYISIVNFDGSKAAQKACTKVDFVIYNELKLPDEDEGEGEDEGEDEGEHKPVPPIKEAGPWYFFRGPLGASNCSQELEDLLSDYSGYHCWMIKANAGNPNKAYLNLSKEQEIRLAEDIKKLAQFSFQKRSDYIILEWDSGVDEGDGFWE